MRKKLVAGNWKMNASKEMVDALVPAIVEAISGGNSQCAVFPPFPYLPMVAELAAGSELIFGGQDMSAHEAGAYTGEVAASMLQAFGSKAVILGHSERREYHGESDGLVADKVVAAVSAGLVPVLCVGETLDERESGQTEAVVARQLDAVLSRLDDTGMSVLVIAYEPVWAIGTGKTATPEQAQEVHAFIRARVAEKDAASAEKMQILYGGSMKPDNAGELMSQADIDGGLIGGASLKAEDFIAIYQAAEKTG